MTERDRAVRPSSLVKSLVANAILLPPATVGAAVLARRWWRARAVTNVPKPLRPPLRTVPLAEFDAAFAPHPIFGPTLDAEVRFIGRGAMHVLGGASDVDSWVLAVLAKHAHTMFEFGTCTGKTSYLWAVNSPPDARITTLTLPPESRDVLASREGTDEVAIAIAAGESVCTDFLYSGTEAEAKVTQMFGDSMTFDETPFLGQCDLIFVDGAHSYSYVVSDTAKALRMLRPGGVVLWHDYYPGHVDAQIWGPNMHLEGLVERMPLVHLEGTAIAAYRHPAT